MLAPSETESKFLIKPTTMICWLMFRYSFRVERVYDAGDVVLVEVSILGQCEIHEVTK